MLAADRLDPDDIEALTARVGAVPIRRDALLVSGPDAVAYLQGQLSQDVARLTPGESRLSFLLQPQGRLDAVLRVTRTSDEAFVLDTDAGWGEAVATRLNRFKLRTKVLIETLDWRALALRGAGLDRGAVAVPDGGLVAEAPWPGFGGLDLLGPDVTAPAGVRLCAEAAYEALRIRAGVPAMGTELDGRTIPAETGLVDLAASFTKGCYTGQELVARMDSRGAAAPRSLRRVVVDADHPSGSVPAGAEVVVSGKVVAVLTSVAEDPGGVGTVALGLVRRDVVPPADAEVRWDGTRVPARVEAL